MTSAPENVAHMALAIDALTTITGILADLRGKVIAQQALLVALVEGYASGSSDDPDAFFEDAMMEARKLLSPGGAGRDTVRAEGRKALVVLGQQFAKRRPPPSSTAFLQ
ncbi:MAG: hypothetical protein ACHQAY_05330 [Hyphomicrobiales bacterium]